MCAFLAHMLPRKCWVHKKRVLSLRRRPARSEAERKSTETFRLGVRLTTVRCCSALVVLLSIFGLAPACVAGWDGQPAKPRCRVERLCAQKKPGKSIKPPATNKCGLRNFVQLQFVRFSATNLSRPLLNRTGEISFLAPAVIVFSSIGSPETDRGPPLL